MTTRPTLLTLDTFRVSLLERAIGRDRRNRLLSSVIEQAPRALGAIENAVAAGQPAVAASEAHGLRVAMATVGAERLMAALERVEAGTADPDAVRAVAEQVDALVQAARHLLIT